ncbi:TPA: hypothetical protein ACH3X1_013131 [Trebouxia sp. C0004]
MASSPEHLQALIDALSSYCAILHMQISVPKTKIMVVSPVAAPAVAFSCNDNPIEQAVLVPVLQYGCRVWGMHSPRVAAANRAPLELQCLYDYYLRTICGLLPSTPHRMLFAQLGLLPLQVLWWQQTLRFWNSFWLRCL